MKKYYTISDGGCFLFGNKDFSFDIPNDYGDCRNTVLVFDTEAEFLEYTKKYYGEHRRASAFKWKTSVNGSFNLYNYDCSDMSPKDIKAKFDGRYSIYLRSDEYELPILAIVKK